MVALTAPVGTATRVNPNRPMGRMEGPPPPPPEETEDSVGFSEEALALLQGKTPTALTEVVADLQGDRNQILSDLQAIGDYFRTQPGGMRALTSFMESTFSPEDLNSFRNALAESGMVPPPPPPGTAPR